MACLDTELCDKIDQLIDNSIAIKYQAELYMPDGFNLLDSINNEAYLIINQQKVIDEHLQNIIGFLLFFTVWVIFFIIYKWFREIFDF